MRARLTRVGRLLSRVAFRIALPVVVVTGPVACSSAIEAPSHAPTAHAALTASERALLARGGLVTRPMVVEKGEHRYVGGAAYQVVAEEPAVVARALESVEIMQRVLPKTRRAELIRARASRAGGRPDQWVVELEQGGRWVTATYSVVLKRHHRGPATQVRFELDRTRPHDVEALWGYFSIEPWEGGGSLFSVFTLVDLGSAFAFLYEGKIQALILATPTHVRDYFAAQNSAKTGPAPPVP